MSTNTMELNPPETAPKDRIILAVFDPSLRFYAAAWNSQHKAWDFAFSSHSADIPHKTRNGYPCRHLLND